MQDMPDPSFDNVSAALCWGTVELEFSKEAHNGWIQL
jgi:hypothetical protein